MMVALDTGSVGVMQGMIKANPLVQVAQGTQQDHFGNFAALVWEQGLSHNIRADRDSHTQTQQEPYQFHANFLFPLIFL
jgi:hypothetical protein